MNKLFFTISIKNLKGEKKKLNQNPTICCWDNFSKLKNPTFLASKAMGQ